MAVKKTQMYRRNLDGTETNLNPLTESQYVLMENGQTVQEVLSDRDSDKYTPVITNSSSTFKVGQGDNVDLSSSMKEGAYDSCVLKGKTMVNCIQEPSNKDVVLPYEFEDGQYVTIKDTKESGALGVELKGQTLVNIHKPNTPSLAAAEQGWYENLTRASGEISFDVLSTPTGWRYINAGKLNYQMLKPNTKYLVVFESSQNLTSIHFLRGDGLNGLAPSTAPVQNNKAIITTSSQIVANEQILYVNFRTEPNTKVGFKNPMIIEYQQGMENWDFPYFKGMTSCKMPILHSVNQMFDYSCATKPTNTGTISFANDGKTLKTNFNVTRDCVNVTNITLPAGTYEISYKIRGSITLPEGASLSSSRAGLTLFRSSEAWSNCRETLMINYATMDSVNYTKATKNFTFDEPVTVTVVYHGWNNSPVGWCELTDIRIVPQGKSSILSLPEEVVLRSLSNGVKDTLNLTTGEYVQRIGEVTLTGGESFVRESNAQYNRFQYKNSGCITQSQRNPINSNTFVSVTEAAVHRNQMGFAYGGVIYLYSPVGSTQTVEEFKTWLQDNPTTIQYQLAKPVVTKVNLSSILKSWNTTTHFYSEIPENTLYPTLSHSNPSYPVILKPSTKYSIVANSYSNNHTNSAINFNLGGATASTTVGNRVTTITTPSTLSNELLTMSGRGNKLNNVMVIEGDVVGDESYFEGICDCKSPILSNVGKNLFDVNGEWHKSTYSHGVPMFTNGSQTITTLENGVQITTNNNQYHGGFGQFINIGGINKLRIAFTGEYTDTKTHPEIVVQLLRKGEELPKTMNGTLANTDYNPRKTSFKLSRSGETVSKVISTQGYECAYVHLCGGYLASMSGTYTFVAKNICIEDADQVDIYEPYKSNILSFDQKDDKTIVLRSLPNGVCDTLNAETGEYVQRIGEVVLDKSYNVFQLEETNTHYRFGVTLSTKKFNNRTELNVICNKLPSATTRELNIEFVHSDGWNENVLFWISKNKLEEGSVQGFKNLLDNHKNNGTPFILQYELKTPTTSTIDVQGFPYAYTNGHVQLSSGSIEQSLSPKVEYSLSANKTGQINSNTKRVSAHQKQLDDFEAMMLTQMVQSAYDKAILQFDYEMQMMSLGGE